MSAPDPPPIPGDVSEVDGDWVLGLIAHLEGPRGHLVKQVSELKVERDLAATREGVLSDFCRAKVHLEREGARPYLADLFIKVAPTRMRRLVTQYNLFRREISFYR